MDGFREDVGAGTLELILPAVDEDTVEERDFKCGGRTKLVRLASDDSFDGDRWRCCSPLC